MSENPIRSENSASLVSRAKGIITNPATEWPKIAAETNTPADIFLKYALPLILIGPICSFIGMQFVGINIGGYSFQPGLGMLISSAIASLVSAIVSLFIVSFIANFLAPKFGGKDDFNSAFKLVAYAMTAAWISGVFSLIPMLGILGLLVSLYSIYLFYTGAKPVMGVPEDKASGYTAVTIILAIVISIVLGAVTAAIVGTPGMTGM